MKRIIWLMLALLTLGSQTEVVAQKTEKKEKKEKSVLKWDWDGKLSKNKVIDKYLLTIDNLYNKVQTYKEDFGTYNMNETTLYDESTGKFYKLAYMTNKNGQLVTRSRINWQFAQGYAEGTQIFLDLTNAGVQSVKAVKDLFKRDPLIALKYSNYLKYVKGGPIVINEGIKNVKIIRGICIVNSRTWKSMKDGAIKDAATLGLKGINSEIANKLNKCAYIMEVKEDSPEYPGINEKYREMTSEEIAYECGNVLKEIELSMVLPEDAMKKAEELPDIDKELEELKDEGIL